MGSNLNFCGVCMLVLLVILNILFVLFGAVLIGVGSWLIATDNSFAYITGNSIISGAALIIIAGIVVVFICVFGIVGAVFKWRPVLVVYAVVVGIVVVLEVVAGIIAIVLRNSFANRVDELSEEAIGRYNDNPFSSTYSENLAATNFINAYQDVFECCGYNNASDWISLNPRLLLENLSPIYLGIAAPTGYLTEGKGCFECNPAMEGCTTFTGIIDNNVTVRFNVTTKGCRNDVHNLIVVGTSVIGALGILFGIIESLGVVLALVLCCCITSSGDNQAV